VYPIFDLRRLGLGVNAYVRLLEGVIIETLSEFGIEGQRETGATGVWVEVGSGQRARKIAAIGVRVARWVTMHGLALNVDPDLSHFDAIVPCGLAGRGVTSISQISGAGAPTLDAVKARLVGVMASQISALSSAGAVASGRVF
jgi:lipoyl(octanoyl) transferase